MNIEVLDEAKWLERIHKPNHSSRSSYLAMYSTWWNGIVTQPHQMMIPIDDHQVHRGDGVFEALKVIQNKVYLLDEHLNRMERSAAAIGLKNPLSRKQIKEVIEQTMKAAGVSSALLRLFLGRGPGSFSANPYESVGEQLHLIVTELKPFDERKVKHGVTLATSKIPAKESWLAQIKSCNYLTNVLMKKEAVDLGVDFTVGVDDQGHLTEGSTENLILLSDQGELIRPSYERILAGTTMLRVFELAAEISQDVSIRLLGEQSFSVADLLRAQEVMMVGTTLDVLSVTEFNGQKIGDGKPGPFAMKMREMILKDQMR